MDYAKNLIQYFKSHLDDSLLLLRRLVELESYSHDKPGVDRLASFLAREFQARGAAVTLHKEENSGNTLVAEWQTGGEESPVMVLGHLDTVWPPGTIGSRPFSLREGKASGPGIFDMKAGLLLSLLICQAFHERKALPGKNVIFFFTPDEEIGTTAGLPRLGPVAETCRAVLCLEPPLPGGKVKTFRKGVGDFKLTVRGVAAHAGVEHQSGASAIAEVSRIVLKLEAMTNYSKGITVNVGAIRGGTVANVVPEEAEVEVDLRFPTASDGEKLEESIRSLRPSDTRCIIKMVGGINRPPLERTPSVVICTRRPAA
jgi:glutamate carboxypeptidase